MAHASSSVRWIDRALLRGILRVGSAAFYTISFPSLTGASIRGLMGSVIKKRRKAMNKHKHRKRLKKERWQRRHG